MIGTVQVKRHLLKRLLMSFVSGNGNLHMENLSLLQHEDQIYFSPVYDPTPMRAYSRHDMPSVMSFGNYGERDAHDKPINLGTAILRLSKNLSINRNSRKEMLEEVLYASRHYVQRIQSLSTLPDDNKTHLSTIALDMMATLVLVQV